MKPLLADLVSRYRVTHVLWHQGEADFVLGTSADAYRRDFLSFAASLRAQGRGADLRVEGDAVLAGLEGPQPRPHSPRGAGGREVSTQKRRRHGPLAGRPGSVRRLPLRGVGPDESGQGLGRTSFAPVTRRAAQDRSATLTPPPFEAAQADASRSACSPRRRKRSDRRTAARRTRHNSLSRRRHSGLRPHYQQQLGQYTMRMDPIDFFTRSPEDSFTRSFRSRWRAWSAWPSSTHYARSPSSPAVVVQPPAPPAEADTMFHALADEHRLIVDCLEREADFKRAADQAGSAESPRPPPKKERPKIRPASAEKGP